MKKRTFSRIAILLLILWRLLNIYGLVGVAIAWVLQVADTIILFIMVNRLLFIAAPNALKKLLSVGIVLFPLVSGDMIPEIAIKWMFLQLMLLTFSAAAWFVNLTTQERGMTRNHLKMVAIFK